MGWLKHGRDEKYIQNVGQEVQREQSFGVNRIMILKLILKRHDILCDQMHLGQDGD